MSPPTPALPPPASDLYRGYAAAVEDWRAAGAPPGLASQVLEAYSLFVLSFVGPGCARLIAKCARRLGLADPSARDPRQAPRFSRDEVSDSDDLKRIEALPRRPPPPLVEQAKMDEEIKAKSEFLKQGHFPAPAGSG